METAIAIEARRKKIIIDYPSLYKTFEQQGMRGGVNAKILKQVLIDRVVPEARLQGNPIAVVTPGIKRRIGAHLHRASFTVIEVIDLPDEDDACVISEINRVDPVHTTDIVLVGVDADYYLALKAKQDEGVVVTLAALDLLEDGSSSISENMRQAFEVFDLSPFKDDLAVRVPVVDKRPRSRRRDPENVVIVVTIQDEVVARKHYLALLQKFLDEHGLIGRID